MTPAADEKTPLKSNQSPPGAEPRVTPLSNRSALFLVLLIVTYVILHEPWPLRGHRHQIPIHPPKHGRSLNIQAKNLTQSALNARRAKEVKAVFRESYAVYEKHAFGGDSVNPVTGTTLNDRNGWGATIVDSLSTMLIMGLDDLYERAVKHVAKVDFTHSDTSVSVFETTIRYIGGLLSAYELNGHKDKALLRQAITLADKLMLAWSPERDLPVSQLAFHRDGSVTANAGLTNLAEAGTLILEYAVLSRHTGDDRYRAFADRTMRFLSTGDVLPGLPAQWWDVRQGKPLDTHISWGGASDAYFEYLIKQGLYANDSSYVDAWKLSIDSSIQHLAQRSSKKDLLFLADHDDGKIVPVSSHLAGFAGGNWLLGGGVLRNETILKLGYELVESAYATYDTPTGLGPETLRFAIGNETVPEEWKGFYERHGFFCPGPRYFILRPEVMESNFMAYRMTGNPVYQERAYGVLLSLRRSTRTWAGGYFSLDDVFSMSSRIIDNTPSFFFAELLKYLYLTFSDPELISIDRYIFNTEAHPFVLPP